MSHLKKHEIEKLWHYLLHASTDLTHRDAVLHGAFGDELKVLFEELRYEDEGDTRIREYEENSSFGNQLDEIIRNATNHFKECPACFEEYHLHVKEHALACTLGWVNIQRDDLGVDDPTSFKNFYPRAIQKADYLHLLEEHTPNY